MNDLPAKQKLFVLEYLKDRNLNATAAYKRAGYKATGKTAEVNACRLLRNAKVKAAIDLAMEERSKRIEIEADTVLQELAKMAFANLSDFITIQEDGSAYVDLRKASRDQLAALSEISVDEYTEGRGEDARNVKRVKIKMSDKRGNLELLGKHLKLFTERVEIDDLRSATTEELEAEARALARQIVERDKG